MGERADERRLDPAEEARLRARCRDLNTIGPPGRPQRTEAEQAEFLDILRRLGTLLPGD